MYTEIAIIHNTHNIVITGSKEVSSKEQLMQSTCQAGVRRVTGANNKHNSEYLRRRAKAQLRAEPPASHHRQPNNPHTHNINIQYHLETRNTLHHPKCHSLLILSYYHESQLQLLFSINSDVGFFLFSILFHSISPLKSLRSFHC